MLALPKPASSKLPSRGMVIVEGTINGAAFWAPLEPDGKGSHWLEIDKSLAKKAKLKPGNDSELEIEPMKEWPDPKLPADLKKALETAGAKAKSTWKSTTPKARWEWVRWIRATSNPATRDKRIGVGISKLSKGMKRPCCFNASMCTIPDVAKSGVLIEPSSEK